MNNEINTVYDDIRRKHDSKSMSSHRVTTAGALRVAAGSGGVLLHGNMEDEEQPSHPVFYDDENPANDELDTLSSDIRRKHDSKSSSHIRAPGALTISSSSRPSVDLLNEHEKMQLAMRSSEASLPGAVHHAPGQAPVRAKPTQSSQLSLFARFRRNPKEAHRGPIRHTQDDGERMVDSTGRLSAVEQEPLDEMHSRMNIFKRKNDSMENMEVQRKQRRNRYVLFGFVGICIIVGVVAGVVVGINSNNNNQQDTSLGTAGSAPDAEDDLVDFVVTVAGCLEEADYEVSQRFTRLQSIVTSEFTGMNEAIDAPGTPARAALCWVAEVDTFDVDTTTEEKSVVTQRFTMALIYFHFVLNLDSESDSKLPTSNWLHAFHECDWDYVDCDEESVVVGLRMSALDLQGAIPSELMLLNKLSSLELRGNSLVRTIPSEIWTLESLETLSLGSNFLTGTISSNIRNLLQLRVFSAPNNILAGTIPDLSGLSKIETLRLGGDGLTGMFPNLQETTNLKFLTLTDLFLSGTIPSYLGSLSNLRLLKIGQMNLFGAIPTEIGMLTRLRTLQLDEMGSVSGSIPTELGQLSQLTHLDLSKMFQLSGTVPSELGLLTNLETLILQETRGLTGSIPPEVCDLSSQSLTQLVEVCFSACETKCPVVSSLAASLQRLVSDGN